jgi:hypothetical protein
MAIPTPARRQKATKLNTAKSEFKCSGCNRRAMGPVIAIRGALISGNLCGVCATRELRATPAVPHKGLKDRKARPRPVKKVIPWTDWLRADAPTPRPRLPKRARKAAKIARKHARLGLGA